MKLLHKNLLLTMAVVALIATPIFMNKESSFIGTDDLASQAAARLGAKIDESSDESPLAQHESLLFTLQGALGAGVIGYYFGYQSGKKKGRE